MKLSQKDRLRNLFESRRGQWIPLPEIADMRIMQYGRVVHEIRREGLNIENKTQFINGVQHSWFRYVPCAAAYKKQEKFDFSGIV